jgi:hypothetical protein
VEAVEVAAGFAVFAAFDVDAVPDELDELDPQPASTRLASASESAAFFIYFTPVWVAVRR